MVAVIFSIIWFAVCVSLTVLVFASMWKVYRKAGQPGWAAIIPFYNMYILLKIADKPGWWLILFFIPFVNFVMCIITYVAVAEKFGKGVGFGIGLFFLGFIFFPILAFGDAKCASPAPQAA